MSHTATATRRRTYSRDDVQTHYDHGSSNPAVNIKRHLWESGDRGDFPTSLLTTVAADYGYDPDEFVTWWRTMADEDEDEFDRLLDAASGWACEGGFEDARTYADDIFPRHVDIWQEGRSGGWLVVGGLGYLDEWDAVMVAKWRKFERLVRGIVDYHAENVAVLVAINAYEMHLDDLARAKAWHETGRWESKFAGTPLAGMVAVA